MPTRYMIDTDICIYLRSNDRPKITARFAGLHQEDVAISVVTFGELAYGAAKSADAARAAQGFEWAMRVMPTLPLPPAAGEIYGRLRAELERDGKIIGGNDLWIAAHALAENLTLVTNNEREFKRITGLKVENWAR